MFRSNKEFFDASFGIAKCLEFSNKFSSALDCAKKMVTKYPNFSGAIVEKMKLELTSQEWERCIEAAERALATDPQCLEAYRFKIIKLLANDGQYKDVYFTNEN